MEKHWVEERAEEDRLYFSQGPPLWKELKDALVFAVAEYHRHYIRAGTEEITVEACGGGDPNCVRLKKLQAPQPQTLEIRFNIQKLAVTWDDVSGIPIPNKGKPALKLSIHRGKVELMSDEKSMDVGEASRIILDGFLFPNGRRQPIAV